MSLLSQLMNLGNAQQVTPEQKELITAIYENSSKLFESIGGYASARTSGTPIVTEEQKPVKWNVSSPYKNMDKRTITCSEVLREKFGRKMIYVTDRDFKETLFNFDVSNRVQFVKSLEAKGLVELKWKSEKKEIIAFYYNDYTYPVAPNLL